MSPSSYALLIPQLGSKWDLVLSDSVTLASIALAHCLAALGQQQIAIPALTADDLVLQSVTLKCQLSSILIPPPGLHVVRARH